MRSTLSRLNHFCGFISFCKNIFETLSDQTILIYFAGQELGSKKMDSRVKEQNMNIQHCNSNVHNRITREDENFREIFSKAVGGRSYLEGCKDVDLLLFLLSWACIQWGLRDLKLTYWEEIWGNDDNQLHISISRIFRLR